MDKINIKNLEVFAKHGVLPGENVMGQKFLISAALYMDVRSAGRTDELTETLDYSELCCVIKAFVEDNTFRLIETVAERLAEKLLIENPQLKKIWLEIKKPWAPIAIPLEMVSVEIERGWHTAYIALGSNIGKREEHLRFAVSELEQVNECRGLRVSEFFDTAPYGFTGQDIFLNGCLTLETVLTPHELLDLLHEIENKAGRERTIRWGPRTLDLDIVFYDDIIMSGDTLRIPHADMHNREFVLRPLSEIAPNLLHPLFKKTVAELLNDLKAES